MIELPEALCRAEELKENLAGKTVEKVDPPSSPHKFCWFNGEPEEYDGMLAGRTVEMAEGFGSYAELFFDGGKRLCVNDGVNLRLIEAGGKQPDKYQLRIHFTDGMSLAFTVAMYGGIICHDGSWENEYYKKSREGVPPLSEDFDPAYFESLLETVKPSMSAKAFLATEQRIPGIGNGVLQDILFEAGIHPKCQVGTWHQKERQAVFSALKSVLREMTKRGGRDTEKDLFGRPGRYRTRMSKNTLGQPCPRCRTEIVKMAYLGGAVYFCPWCQVSKKCGI